MVAENPLVVRRLVGFAADDPPLDLSVKGLIDLRVLSALTSAVAFDGNADVNTLIKGTIAKPLLDGRITLDDAEIAIVGAARGAVGADGADRARRPGRGHSTACAAWPTAARWRSTARSNSTAWRSTGGELNIQAQGVALELPKGLRSELDALVIFRPDPQQPVAHRRHPHRAKRLHRNHHASPRSRGRRRCRWRPTVGAAVSRSFAAQPRRSTTTDDIIVDNNYGRLAAGANVRVIGTVAQPGIEGRITLREGGQIFLAGRTFRITRGDISFTDRRDIHPEFNIVAEAKLGAARQRDHDADRHAASGRRSISPPRTGSRTPGEIAAELVGSTNTETALTLLSADLLGVTGRAIGLDAFRVERGEFEDSDFRDYHEDPTVVGANRTDPTTRSDGGQAAQRTGGVHGVAEPARERQGHVHRQLLPAPQRRAARRCRATAAPSASACATR